MYPDMVSQIVNNKASVDFKDRVTQVTNLLTEFVPAGVYSFYIILCTYLLPESGQCKGALREYLIFIVVVGCLVVGFDALHFSETASITTRASQTENKPRDYIRAGCAMVSFLALALVTPPGSTCLLGFVSNNWKSRIGSIVLLAAYLILTAFASWAGKLPPPPPLVNASQKPLPSTLAGTSLQDQKNASQQTQTNAPQWSIFTLKTSRLPREPFKKADDSEA